jgi:hypothetical protein
MYIAGNLGAPNVWFDESRSRRSALFPLRS